MTRGKHLNQVFVETPEASESHAPDAWGMYIAEEKTTADDVLLGILANSTAVKLATEEQEAAHGAANDVSRLVSEYEHLNTAISTRQLGEWVTNTHGPDALRDLQRNPDWRKLVRAWVPGQVPDGEFPHAYPRSLKHSMRRLHPPARISSSYSPRPSQSLRKRFVSPRCWSRS